MVQKSQQNDEFCFKCNRFVENKPVSLSYSQKGQHIS